MNLAARDPVRATPSLSTERVAGQRHGIEQRRFLGIEIVERDAARVVFEVELLKACKQFFGARRRIAGLLGRADDTSFVFDGARASAPLWQDGHAHDRAFRAWSAAYSFAFPS